VLSRGFVVLWIAMFVAMVGLSMVSPLLPIFVRDDLGGPAVAVALSFSGLTLAQLFAAPVVGRFGDRLGPKRFIVGGFLVYCVGALGYLVATNWETVVAFRVLSGVGAAGIFPMAMAYVGRLSPPGREGRFMGWFSVAQIAGFGIGPLLGGGLRDAAGSDWAFATMALLLGGTALLTFLLLPSRPRRMLAGMASEDDAAAEETPELPWTALLRRRAVQGSVLYVMLTSLGWGAAATWLAVFVVSDEGLATGSAVFVGLLLSSRSLINATLQPFTGILADRWNRILLVVIGLSISGVGQLLIPLVPASLVDTSIAGIEMTIAPWVLAVLVIAGIAESLAFPAQQAVFVTIGRRVGMGSLMGLNSMGSSAGFLTGSLLGAGIVGWFGIEAVFIAAGGVTLFGTLMFWLLMHRAADELVDPALQRHLGASLAATEAAEDADAARVQGEAAGG
jgi:DHA1 family multidrug resistance protein-like MFS transporter